MPENFEKWLDYPLTFVVLILGALVVKFFINRDDARAMALAALESAKEKERMEVQRQFLETFKKIQDSLDANLKLTVEERLKSDKNNAEVSKILVGVTTTLSGLKCLK